MLYPMFMMGFFLTGKSDELSDYFVGDQRRSH